MREEKGKGREKRKKRNGKGRRGEEKGREEREMDGRGGEGPLRLRIPGNFFYPSPPLSPCLNNNSS